MATRSPTTREPRGAVRLDDTRTFAALYDEHATEVYRAAYAVVRDRHAAEDVVQEVFLRLWHRPGSFDVTRGDLGPYLRLVARSRALDAWRRTASSQRTADRYEAEVATAAPREQEPASLHAERAETAAAVRANVRALPGAQREAVVLTYWGGMTAGEIAARSGAPLGTVKSRIRLGLARLSREAQAA